ncbi:MAG: 6-carboxytetrahydropterin synthase [Burkholderiaceae bacterium]|jgi:6-pyruvoyltetrahydropterin/6-carboxytetrahydropterin synthase|nr:6-carboxytetrahydropterin synthase [Burkholderiaceae bacterium]
MYQLSITREFIARHRLVGGDWGAENATHSHRYRADIVVEGHELDEHGFLVDIVALGNAADDIVAQLGERVLNDLPAFDGLNPSLEHFARIFHAMLAPRVDEQRLALTVRLWENDRNWAAYRR